MAKSCKTCKHLDVALNRQGRRVVWRDYAYACTAPMPDLRHIMPNSFECHQVKSRRMEGVDGGDCPTWQAYNLKNKEGA